MGVLGGTPGLRVRWFLCFFSMAFLGGCAVFGPEPAGGLTDAQRQLLYALNEWQVQGRIAVRAGDDSWHASLVWNHEPKAEALKLSGPLGQGAVDVWVSEAFIRITHADGTTEVSSRPQELLSERLGFPVPLDALRYWVLGLPAPGLRAATDVDATGRMQSIRQLGWTVEYERFMTVGERILPQKLSVRKGGLMLKLVIDQWHEKVGHG